MDLEKQFKKDGKCKSDFCQYFREIGSLDEEPIFIERYYLKFLFGSNFFFFFWSKFFFESKNFSNQKIKINPILIKENISYQKKNI